MLSFSLLSLLPALVLLWATPGVWPIRVSEHHGDKGSDPVSRLVWLVNKGFVTESYCRQKKKPQDTSSSDHTHTHAHTPHTRIGREKTGVSGVTGMHAIRVSSTSRRNRNTALDQGANGTSPKTLPIASAL